MGRPCSQYGAPGPRCDSRCPQYESCTLLDVKSHGEPNVKPNEKPPVDDKYNIMMDYLSKMRKKGQLTNSEIAFNEGIRCAMYKLMEVYGRD